MDLYPLLLRAISIIICAYLWSFYGGVDSKAPTLLVFEARKNHVAKDLCGQSDPISIRELATDDL